jgi:hypothetical protein
MHVMKTVGWMWGRTAAGICIGVVLVLVLVGNAAFMVASPRAWFRLPVWFRMTGSLSEREYATGWGAVEVRLLGAVIIATTIWVVYDMISN